MEGTPALVIASARAREGAEVALRSLRRDLAALDPVLPVADLQSARDALRADAEGQAFLATVLASLAGLALGMCFLGTYGVAAQEAILRQREAATRMALGAGRARAVTEALARPVRCAAAGLLAGLGLAWMAHAWLRHVLFQSPRLDVGSWLAPLALVAGALLAAGAPPVWRSVRKVSLPVLLAGGHES